METSAERIPLVYEISFWLTIVVLSALVIWSLTRLFFSTRGEGQSAIARMISAKNAGIEPKASQAVIESGQRFWIALMVVLLSVGILAFLVLVAIVNPVSEYSKIDKLLTVLLPVIGTWVGTVLAFYFARENLQAASTSALEMYEARGAQILQTTLVQTAMLPRNRIQAVTIERGGDEAAVKLNKLDAIISRQLSRCPILTEDDVAKYVVHKSILYEYVAKHGGDEHLAELGLDGLVKEHPAVRSLVFIAPGASLADAKNSLAGKPGCQDIFVTENAAPDKPVQGWLTNVDIEEYSKV